MKNYYQQKSIKFRFIVESKKTKRENEKEALTSQLRRQYSSFYVDNFLTANISHLETKFFFKRLILNHIRLINENSLYIESDGKKSMERKFKFKNKKKVSFKNEEYINLAEKKENEFHQKETKVKFKKKLEKRGNEHFFYKFIYFILQKLQQKI